MRMRVRDPSVNRESAILSSGLHVLSPALGDAVSHFPSFPAPNQSLTFEALHSLTLGIHAIKLPVVLP